MPFHCQNPQLTILRLSLFLTILTIIVSGCSKKIELNPQRTEASSNDAEENKSSNSEKATENEAATESPNYKGQMISVRLPGGKNSPTQYTVIDTTGNMLLPLIEHEVANMFDVGVVTPPFSSPYFFVFCEEGCSVCCGIMASTGEQIIPICDGKTDEACSWLRNNVMDVHVLKDGKFFFEVEGWYYSDALSETFKIPGAPEWEYLSDENDEDERDGDGGEDRFIDSEGESIPSYRISKNDNGDRALVWYYSQKAECDDSHNEEEEASCKKRKRCELISLADKKKLNKIDLIDCGYKINALFPVVPTDSEGLWGYMNPEGDMVIPAMFHWTGDFMDNDYAIVKISLDHAKKLCADAQNSPSSANPDFLAACAEGFSAWEKAEEVCSSDPKDVESKLSVPAVARSALLCYHCVDTRFGTSDIEDYCAWTNNWTHERFVDIGWTKINKNGQIIDRFDYKAEDILTYDHASNFNSETLGSFYQSEIAKQYNYYCITDLFGDIAFARDKAGRYGIVDRNMQEIVSPQFEFVDDGGWVCSREHFFYNDVAIVKKDGLYGYIDMQGKLITPIQYEEAERIDGFARVKRNGLWGYIDRHGKEIVKPQYEEVNHINDQLFVIKRGGVYGVINTLGKEIVKPQYEKVDHFNNQLFLVRQGGLYGLINTLGKEIVEPKYEEVWYIRDDVARVKRDGLYGYIDRQGNEIIEPKFQDAAYEFNHDRAFIKMDGKYGYIDRQGHVVIEPKWDGAEDFDDTTKTALVYNMVNDEKQYSLITMSGDILPVEYCLAPNPDYRYYNAGPFIYTFVRCHRAGNGFGASENDYEFSSCYLNELNSGPSNTDIRWEESAGEYRLVNAKGENIASYHLKIKPTITITGLSTFVFFSDPNYKRYDLKYDNSQYLGWINAEGKIIWPPNWNDPCTNTKGIVVWPEGSCKK